MATITITIPDTPKEREEVLSYLESKGLVKREEVEEAKPQKGRWAKVAEEMASHGYMSGKTGEKMLESIRELREDFEIRDPFESKNT